MGNGARREYAAAIKGRYQRSDRRQKAAILDEFCAVCGYNRKYAIRLLGQKKRPARRRRSGPRPLYDGSVLAHLKALWLATDQMCSRKLVVAIRLWMPYYEAEYGGLDPTVRAKLLKLSPATCDRLLGPSRARLKQKGKCTTRPGRLLRNVIPIRPDKATMDRPGFIEADTVAHCGDSLEGQFAWSITYTDIRSGWTDNRAVWGKGATGVVQQTREMEASLAFPIIAFWSDNGGEFLNNHLWRYFAYRDDPIHFARSRPYKKDDNAHVEQKNWTHVRQLLGYDRIDKAELVPMMNDIYTLWGPYQNHFSPARRLVAKTRINSKWVKKYDKPKTPYQRLLDSTHVDEQAKEDLKVVHKTLNPFHLKKEIEKKLKQLFNDLWKHEP
jgi:hypothetical protein